MPRVIGAAGREEAAQHGLLEEAQRPEGSPSPPAPEDPERWAEWFNDLEVALPLGDEAHASVTADSEREVLAEAMERPNNIFSIVDAETDHLAGRRLLFGLDQVNRTAMLGMVIGEKACCGKGYGQEAAGLMLDYAFDRLNLNSVALGVFAFNERAIDCYKRVGFKETGRRRQARMIGETKLDLVLMDILAEECGASRGHASRIAGLISPR